MIDSNSRLPRMTAVLRCLNECHEVPDSEKRARGMDTKSGHEHFDYKDLEVVNTAHFEKNTLVWFINAFTSVHAVTPRSPTKYR